MTKLFFPLLALTLFLVACNKDEEVVRETETAKIEAAKSEIDATPVLLEDILNTPAVQMNADDAEVEIIESNDAGYRLDCCSIGVPFNLTGGTNRFRTEFEQEPGYTIRYTVTRYEFIFPNINTTQVASWEYNLSFEDCTNHHNIMDVDWFASPAIVVGGTYRLSAVLYDSTDIDGCFEFSSLWFTGE